MPRKLDPDDERFLAMGMRITLLISFQKKRKKTLFQEEAS